MDAAIAWRETGISSGTGVFYCTSKGRTGFISASVKEKAGDAMIAGLCVFKACRITGSSPLSRSTS